MMLAAYIPVEEMASRLKASPTCGWPGSSRRSTWWAADRKPLTHTLETFEPLLNRMGWKVGPILSSDDCRHPTATMALTRGVSRWDTLYFEDIEEVRAGWARRWAARLWAFETLLRLRRALSDMSTAHLDSTTAWLVGDCKGKPPAGVPEFLIDWPGEAFDHPEAEDHQDGHLTMEGWWAAVALQVVEVERLDGPGVEGRPAWESPRVMLLAELDTESRQRLSGLPGASGSFAARTRL